MRVALTEAKVTKLKQSYSELLIKGLITIGDLSTVIEQMVASPAIEHGKLYYRIIDIEKSAALK